MSDIWKYFEKSTSICSERLFSKSGLIYANTLRNRLSAETVDNILVIKANLDTVYLAPSTEPDPEEMIVENEDD
uniref:HAT C-terminal dimerisation domain-containing protein n=1 Tax=Acrobeloides nanus TaxID=290746 RepID=A0A914E531_9BILA